MHKLFAICDYYLDGKTTEHSRHIYDIHKLLDVVALNEDLKKLVVDVRVERQTHKACPSAQEDVDLAMLLQEIVEKDVYKSDYEEITSKLLFEDVHYATAIGTIKTIIKSNLFAPTT